jgi:hypothetical protein
MYFVCKFFETWTLYEKTNDTSRLVTPAEMQSLRTLFPSLLGGQADLLMALQVTSHPFNKLQQIKKTALSKGSSPRGQDTAGYYICKVSNIWTLYDENLGNGRLIASSESEFLQSFFAALLGSGENMMEAVHLSTIPLNRVQQLTRTPKPEVVPAKNVSPMPAKG